MVARAPNHLGDGVMALPAMRALASLGTLEIRGPRWAPVLYRGVADAIRPPGWLDANTDVAVLFPPSLRAALEARRARRRIGTPTDFRRLLLTDVVHPRVHRGATFAALAAAAGAQPEGDPVFLPAAGTEPVAVPDGHIGLNPIVGGRSVRQWGGFSALAAALPGPLVFYGGPGEDAEVAAVGGAHPRCVGLSLDRFAVALRSCAVFVSNDSGAAHFARACGVPTVVVHGPTAPEGTGPAGAFSVSGPQVPCGPCYRDRCRHGVVCLPVGVDRVAAAVRERLDG